MTEQEDMKVSSKGHSTGPQCSCKNVNPAVLEKHECSGDAGGAGARGAGGGRSKGTLGGLGGRSSVPTQTDAEAPRMRVLRAARPARTLGLRPALRVARRTQTLRMNSCVLEFPSCADKNASNRFALRGAPWNAYSGS